MTTPREYAWKTLCRIVLSGGYASLLLRNQNQDFSKEDTAFISELVYGTLRNYTWLEYQWKDLVKKAKKKTEVLLNMSVYQLQYMDKVPAYAVINEAVNLSEKGEKGFVNAVLRKAAAQGVRPYESNDILQETAVKTSHPMWLMKLWSSHYGKEKAIQTAQHDQQRAIVYGRRNPLKISKEELEGDSRVHFLEDDCFTFDGVLSRTDWFKEGKVLIQDRASQQAARLLEAESGMKVLDVCSAPGTKCQQTAAAMNNIGEIDAHDLHEERVHLIEQLMDATGVTIVHASVKDGSKPDESLRAHYDRILADVPCSGLGDLRHKPEIRMHVKPEDLDALCAVQKQILNAASQQLKPGGIMVYSTCTLNKKENEYQIRSFLEEHEDFRLLKEMTWFPDEWNSDGFYGAKLAKTEGMIK